MSAGQRIGASRPEDLPSFRYWAIPGLLNFELADHLRLAFVEDLKIFLTKISHGASLGIANY